MPYSTVTRIIFSLIFLIQIPTSQSKFNDVFESNTDYFKLLLSKIDKIQFFDEIKEKKLKSSTHHNSTTIYDEDYDSQEEFSTGHVIDFKLSDFWREFENGRKTSQHIHQLQTFLNLFLAESSSNQKPDVSTLRQIRTFLKSKLNSVVSTGCLGDLLYFSDSLLEYNLAQYDMSNVCLKKPKNISSENQDEKAAVDCQCSSKIQKSVDENSWTLGVLDSFGKFPAGFGKGNLWFHGDFEQCTQISVPKSSTKHYWQGRYSRIDFYLYKKNISPPFIEGDSKGIFSGIDNGMNILRLPASLPECIVHFQVKVGLCLPKTCSKSDVETMVSYAINIPQKLLGQRLICAADLLYHDNPSIFGDKPALFVVLVIIAVISLVVFGTCYDYQVHMKNETNFATTCHQDENIEPNSVSTQNLAASIDSGHHPTLVKILLSFSLLKNGRKIFVETSSSTTDSSKKGHVKCLHGIRVLSLIWVVYGHNYPSGLLVVDNLLDAMDMTQHVLNQFILNATLSVDAFFLMSGTLFAFLWMKEMKRTGAKHVYSMKSWILLFLHRYIRLTPVYAFVLAIDIFLVPYVTDGPMWNPSGIESRTCRTGWWTNLLYINNVMSLDRLCMVWSWYLANDMQFFLLSPPLLILLWVNGTVGLSVITLLAVATSIIRGFVIISNENFPPIQTMYNDFDKVQFFNESSFKVYISPHCRIGPYLIGLILAYVLFRYRKSIKLSKIANFAVWIAASAFGLAVLFGIHDFCKTGHMPKMSRFLYGAFGRVSWSIFLAWIILAGSTGHGGPVNTFLSSKRWKPFSRLVYSAYLIHPIVILVYFGSYMTPLHYNGHYQALFLFCGHITLTFFLAFWLSCMVEMPVINLEQYIFGSRKNIQQPRRQKQQIITSYEEVNLVKKPAEEKETLTAEELLLIEKGEKL